MEDKNSIRFKSQIYAATRAQYNTIYYIIRTEKTRKKIFFRDRRTRARICQ